MATHSSILAWRIPMDGGVWWATVHGLTKSWTQLKRLSTHTQEIVIECLCARQPARPFAQIVSFKPINPYEQLHEKRKSKLLSRFQFFATPWNIFSRPEY